MHRGRDTQWGFVVQISEVSKGTSAVVISLIDGWSQPAPIMWLLLVGMSWTSYLCSVYLHWPCVPLFLVSFDLLNQTTQQSGLNGKRKYYTMLLLYIVIEMSFKVTVWIGIFLTGLQRSHIKRGSFSHLSCCKTVVQMGYSRQLTSYSSIHINTSYLEVQLQAVSDVSKNSWSIFDYQNAYRLVSKPGRNDCTGCLHV